MNARREWGIWLALTWIGFTVLETRAIKARSAGQRPSPTLTTTVRIWLGIETQHVRRHVLGPMFAGLLVWFWGHITRGWKP